MSLFNSTYWIYMLPDFLLMGLAQLYVNSTYKKWSQVQASSRASGAEAAERLIRNNGMYEVKIQGVKGNLTDHYDPSQKVLRLSIPRCIPGALSSCPGYRRP
ncbi:MAG: zinc metallopeptidase [Anaerolineales bacterium]|nr:zinc metallopeptidase [Anaerolineales bacterium]